MLFENALRNSFQWAITIAQGLRTVSADCKNPLNHVNNIYICSLKSSRVVDRYSLLGIAANYRMWAMKTGGLSLIDRQKFK
jgi:hypothetical protein